MSKHRSRNRRSRLGFSLIEAVVSSAVLGIGLMGVVKLHTFSVEGVAKGNKQVAAMRIADQRLEQLATQVPEQSFLPNCPTGTDTIGCRASQIALSAPKTCTSWVDSADVPTPAGASSAITTAYTGYRMDVVVGAHPDATNQNGGFLATVSVCWLDDRGFVQQAQARRLLVPGT